MKKSAMRLSKNVFGPFAALCLLLLTVVVSVSGQLRRSDDRPIPIDDNVHGDDASFWSRLLNDDGSLGAISTPSPTPSPSCVPTTGPCVSSKQELDTILSRMEAESVVTLCGDTTIETDEAISINQSSIKLCCETAGCLIESQGSNRNLLVTGSDFTLQGVDFAGGSQVAPGLDGGNVAIQAAGNHFIRDCTFSGGSSDFLGGNLFVDTPNNVTIVRSVFESGQVRYGGGGLGVLNALGTVLNGCTFTDNVAGSDGGGFIVFGDNIVDQEIYIYESTFERNQAFHGGGFLATSFGTMPRLDVQLTTFNDNTAEIGAVASVWHHVMQNRLPLDLMLKDNEGMNNKASRECDGFHIFLDAAPAPASCFGVSQDYPTA